MFVFDSSAYINGWRDHYRPGAFGCVWSLIGAAMRDGRIISPREVLVELAQKDDVVHAWAREFKEAFVDPGADVQREAGAIHLRLDRRGGRHAADPFVIAEAKARGLCVVTYEGRTFSGVPTTRWWRSMPGICNEVEVRACTVMDALETLGAKF